MEDTSTQGLVLEAFLYKLIRFKAFGHYVNMCEMSLMTATTTDAVKVISQDFPDLDLKKPEYGYDEEDR